jgi:hypothetical protein
MNERPDTAIRRYAERLHAQAGTGHHVVSALGAWLVLALCAALADTEQEREELRQLLGTEPQEAADFASDLLTQTHPLVGAGAAVWYPSRLETAQIKAWSAELPSSMETGELPTQHEIDDWSNRRTLGLINRFPLDLSPDVTCILASALATKVSWDAPFEVVAASELAPSAWCRGLNSVLRTPRADHRHQQFLVNGGELGLLAVHLARAQGGLLVGSVIAADEGAPPSKVLGIAHEIVVAEAQEAGRTPHASLFDVPLGEEQVWSISEEAVETTNRNGREERFVTVLPAWTAETKLDLGAESLGFPAAARLLAKAFDRTDWHFAARQSAVARYSAIGFEAAAVTGLMMTMSAPRSRPGVRRNARVRFAHPYAVVAAASEEMTGTASKLVPRVWHGLPIFSAWVSEPSAADPSS